MRAECPHERSCVQEWTEGAGAGAFRWVLFQSLRRRSGEPSPLPLPELFVAIVAEANAGDAAIGIFLEGEASGRSAGIEEGGRAFGQQLVDVSDTVPGHQL